MSFSGNGTIDFDEFLSLIVPTQTENKDPKSELLKAFEAFDTNGDGFVSRKELKEGLEILGEKLSESELNELITKIDSDNSGRIEYKGKRFVTFGCFFLLLKTVLTLGR